jgi:CDP-glycerol glycerophosphotransferase (TagB/SpsB family)
MPIENNNNININNNVNNNNQNLTIINTTESQNNTTEVKRKIKTNSILMMFTWRDLQPRNLISYDYFRNFYNIISSEKLYKELEIHNVTVYLSFHRLVREKDILKFKNLVSERPLIEFIGQHEISECLGRASLVVTDFSSIVFDLMYRKKPYIIYIPDSYDSSLRKIYKPDYWGLIEAMKNNTIKFENKVFSSFETVNKMIFYIQNNFALDDKLERFYQQFGFKMEKSIDKFIDYLVKLN